MMSQNEKSTIKGSEKFSLPRTYIAIDLKSFYASAECTQRHLDPLTTNLVVADASRTDKTICLAVSPSLKAHGISGRARLFEVVQRVKEVNRTRFSKAMRMGVLPADENGRHHFTSASFDAEALERDPSLELSYIVAPPRMRMYEEYSTKIVSIYLKYIAPEDIHVYSIDEVFIDATGYLETYHLTAHELAMTMIREVLYTTGITATAGIGTNLYLAKVAMDIVAKHVSADKDGVRIAELDELSYRKLLWCHKPLTDFWRVGGGISRRLAKLGLYTMGDIARCSIAKPPMRPNENDLYKALGINAELLIDHAWGWEPARMQDIKKYRPQTKSLSSGQVLMEPYPFDKGRLIVREMTELLALDLVDKGLVTKQMVLTISYDRTSISVLRPGRTAKDTVYKVTTTGEPYTGKVSVDYYGRPCPPHAHGTGNLERYTSSTRDILDAVLGIYDRTVDPKLLVRRVNIAACNLIHEEDVPEEAPEQLDLFTDYEALERDREAKAKAAERERKLQKATLALQKKFGKNAVLKGMNLMDGATTIQRNGQVGGHKAE
jgi:DNA polymerase V